MNIVYSAVFSLILVAYSATGAEAMPTFPEGCVAVSYNSDGNNLVLNPDSLGGQSLYLIHNISESAIVVNRVFDDPGASAGWSSEIGPGSWSAFAININNFVMSCMEQGKDSYNAVSCGKALKLCKFHSPQFKNDDGGSYWVSENKPLQNVLEEIKSRGINY